MSKNFTNSKDLVKQIEKDFETGKLRDKNGKPCLSISKEEFKLICEQIADGMQESFREYYNIEPYGGIYYHRTGALGNMQVNVVSIDEYGNDLEGTIRIEDDVYHHSVISSYDGQYDVPLLINYGYKDTSYNSPHFRGYAGARMLDNELAKWKEVFKGKVYIFVNYDGNQYEVV